MKEFRRSLHYFIYTLFVENCRSVPATFAISLRSKWSTECTTAPLDDADAYRAVVLKQPAQFIAIVLRDI